MEAGPLTTQYTIDDRHLQRIERARLEQERALGWRRLQLRRRGHFALGEPELVPDDRHRLVCERRDRRAVLDRLLDLWLVKDVVDPAVGDRDLLRARVQRAEVI